MKSRISQVITVLWVSVILFSLFYIAFHLLILPRMEIARLVVDTELSLSQAIVLRMSGISEDDTYFSVHSERVAERLRGFPQVKEAQVSKTFPDTIHIRLTGRTALALIFVQENADRSYPMVVDEQGILFSRTHPDYDLPVISGLLVTEGRIGRSLPTEVTTLLSGLYTMRDEAPELYASISECWVSVVQEGEYEVLVYPLASLLPVRMSLYLDYATYENALFTMGAFPQDVLVRDYYEINAKGRQLVLHRKGSES